MRSPVIFRRSGSLLRGSVPSQSWFLSAPHPGRAVRKPQFTPHRISLDNRFLSSGASNDEPTTDIPPPAPSIPDVSPDELEKPRRRTKLPSTDKDLEPLPTELDIIWTTADTKANPPDPSILPPPDILEEALNNLHIILHPQTQHRAIYTSSTGPPTEPTFALYCPIEGGDYVIDATVRELAHQTNSEVVVLDSVQLAAGEWGLFGKAANSLQLPRNPLHFPSSPPRPTPGNSHTSDDIEGDIPMPIFTPSQMTVAVMTPLPMQQRRSLVTPSPRRNPTPSKVKIFFDELVNIPTKQHSSPDTQDTPQSRIIYIRDFPTLAPTSSVWYPPLLSAVRQRRQGPLSRPMSPINNPMAIIFGMTPSLTASMQSPSSGRHGTALSASLIRELLPPSITSTLKSEKSLWGEDDASNKARESRLRKRLRKWETSDKSLTDELPTLSGSRDSDGGSSRPEIVLIGGTESASGSSPVLGASMTTGPSGHHHEMPESETNTQFFRTSILVPSVRSLALERMCRMERRREINELTMRMGVGAVGGVLGKREVVPQAEATDGGETAMWEDWGRRIEVWLTVRRIADHAVGSVVSARTISTMSDKTTLDPTDIPWAAVDRAWSAQQSSHDLRKAWTKDSSEKTTPHEEDVDGEKAKESKVDEVVERIKQDPFLDPHEQRLLSCIVDPESMPTSFSQVHLPPHTIDSVRTVVSLPLLHPAAFQQGILKSYGINGVLLFGPAGTGKTLVVRALAKEAGSRMMAINPSDVMDMYVGEGEKLVKSVFSLARRLSPCVVFLDEIDALFGARMSTRESGGAFAHRGVITEFMQEMDGLRSSRDDRVIVIGATNRPFDLDDAVLRRLPRRLLLDLPGEKEREAILRIHLRDETLAPDVEVKNLAKKTESFSGSDLKHLCVSAALDAVKESVELPWRTQGSPISGQASNPSEPSTSSDATTASPPDTNTQGPEQTSSTTAAPTDQVRVLAQRHFDKALKEIIPSSSESLGSLSDLRRWNEEFGEGRVNRKKLQVWGKGTFGFVEAGKKVELQQ